MVRTAALSGGGAHTWWGNGKRGVRWQDGVRGVYLGRPEDQSAVSPNPLPMRGTQITGHIFSRSPGPLGQAEKALGMRERPRILIQSLPRPHRRTRSRTGPARPRDRRRRRRRRGKARKRVAVCVGNMGIREAPSSRTSWTVERSGHTVPPHDH
ncbi:hypothetical protein BC628DRAFT_1339703 [Trametes gibbosa]|nr:hypothetical protein BC628DRAFT_1339703 [Trametes gibbosa]